MSLIREMEQLRKQIELLEARARTEEGRAAVAEEAIEGLQTAGEELRVAEEELQVQSDRLSATYELLDQERRRYRDLFDFAPDAYVTTNAEGVIQEANLAAGRLFRVPPERLAGKPLPVFVEEKDRPRMRRALSEIAKKATLRNVRFLLTPRSGDPIAVEARVAMSIESGEPAARWLLRELSQTGEFERARRSIVETHHRVKNNLQILAAMMDIRLLDGMPTIPREDLQRLSTIVRTFAAMHDLLTLDTKGGGAGHTVDSSLFFETLLPMLQQVAGGKAIRTEVAEFAFSVRQATAVALILHELVSNAVKHSQDGVEIRLATQDGSVELAVLDHGSGFPADFNAAAASHTGLDLVDNLARWDLAGELTFSNSQDGGGMVVVRFPLNRQPTT